MLYLIALYFARVRGTMTEEAYTAAVKELHDLPEKTAEVLKVDARMAEIAKKYAKCENASSSDAVWITQLQWNPL